MSARDPLAERYNLLGHDAPPVDLYDLAAQAIRVLGLVVGAMLIWTLVALARAGAL